MTNKCLLFFTLIVITAGHVIAQTPVKFNNPGIQYTGRIAMRDSAAELSWTANSVKINFQGTGIGIILKDERADNYYNVILDGKVIDKIHPEQAKRLYKLAVNLPNSRHTLELFKRTEWAMGKTWIYGFNINGSLLPASPRPKRKIEFFGNSITCGYADEDSTGQDRGTSPYEDGYLSYAALTAKHYGAEFYNTSKSGIGITVSWFPLIMPEMYDRLDATDPNSKWDFSKYTPDLVIINLFQNDSWIVKLPDNPQFKARFETTAPTPAVIINAYASFVRSIRAKYPKAKILCILGSMDATKDGSPWPGYITSAVKRLNDAGIYTHFIPYKGTPGHPSVKEQAAMAVDLENFIDGNVKW